jgi:hypothetical protein
MSATPHQSFAWSYDVLIIGFSLEENEIRTLLGNTNIDNTSKSESRGRFSSLL